MDAKTLGKQHAFADDLAYNGRSGLKPMGGLTKREYFAAMAMQGIAACYPQWVQPVDAGRLAECAVAVADALLAELAKEDA